MVEVCESPLQLVQYFLRSESLTETCRLSLATPSEPTHTSLIFYLEFLALTLILEAAFYFVALRKEPLLTKLNATVLANVATHPAVCFAFPWVTSLLALSRAIDLAGAEIFAPLVESLILVFVWNVPKVRAFTYMVAANLFSWWFGLIIYSYVAPYMLK